MTGLIAASIGLKGYYIPQLQIIESLQAIGYSRYLINVKHMNAVQAYAIIKDWAMKCNEIMALSPSVREFDNKIRNDIKEAIKNGKHQ